VMLTKLQSFVLVFKSIEQLMLKHYKILCSSILLQVPVQTTCCWLEFVAPRMRKSVIRPVYMSCYTFTRTGRSPRRASVSASISV